jgi:hypothetical protein
MRESPSGQPNPSGSVLFDNFVVGPQGIGSQTLLVPVARVGDTVAWSANAPLGPIGVTIMIQTSGQVVVNVTNPTAAPITINATRIYLEVLRAG